MAYQSIKTPARVLQPGSATASTQVLDTTNDFAGMIFKAPKTGNISKIHAWFSAVSGTPTIRGSLQGVNDARTPDGSILASGGATQNQSGISAGAWQTFTLGSPAAVTAGDNLAAVIDYVSGSTSATVDYGYSSLTGLDASPYAINQNNGVLSTSITIIPTIAVEYDDGTVVGFAFRSTTISTSWTSAANPLYKGNKWTPNANVKVDGFWVTFIRPADAFDFVLELFQAGSGTPLVSVACNGDKLFGTSAAVCQAFIPIPETTLTAGIAYRFAIAPTTANAPTLAVRMDFKDANTFAGAAGGSEWAYTTNDAKDDSWTDTANELVGIFPRITAVNVASGNALLTFGENTLLDGVFRGNSLPGTFYVGLSTTTPAANGTNITEPAGNGYARVAVTNNAINWASSSAGANSNAAQIAFPTASGSWGTVTYAVLFDAATNGNAIAAVPLAASQAIGNGDTYAFAVGAFTNGVT
jgi:hypothetical protein